MSKREARLSNSQMIASVAVVLIAAVIGFLAFAIDKRQLGGVFWGLLALGVGLLVLSVILGGRGVASIDSPGRLFDLQAKACLAGFLLLTASLLFLGDRTQDAVSTRLDSIQNQLGQITARLQQVRADVSSLDVRLDSVLVELPAVRAEISALRARLPD